MASAGDLAVIRSWVGSGPDNADLSSRFSRLGGVYATALEVLRERRANLVANPLNVTLVGDYSEDASKNLAALDADLASLEELAAVEANDPGEGSITFGQLTRPDRERPIA